MTQYAPNRPARWVIVAVEVVLAAAAIIFAFVIWRGVSIDIDFALVGGRTVRASRMSGSTAAAAIGLCTLAGLLLVDAVREAMLAARAGHRRKEPAELAEYQRAEAEERARG